VNDKFNTASKQERAIFLLMYAYGQVYPGKAMNSTLMIKAISKSGINTMSDEKISELRALLVASYEKCIEFVHVCF